MFMIRWRLLMALSAVTASVAACDPTGPGTEGTISLGPDVDASAFQTLVLRAFANPSSAPFDPFLPIPLDAELDYLSLSEIMFPFRYRLGGGIGTTDVETWMFVASLSPRARAPARNDNEPDLAPGDVFCAIPYREQWCDFAGGYCGQTRVNCTLADIVPAAD